MDRNRLLVMWVILGGLLTTSCTFKFYPAGCDHPIPGFMHKHALLDSILTESSGIIYMDGLLWSFNDSGGEASLYGVDPRSGKVIRRVQVTDAVNVDWEDIAMNNQHLFVADVGNNRATRDTVIIYRISKGSMLSGKEEIIHDGIISLSFNETILRDSTGYSSHDCEAILAHGDSIYLFSKDWVHQTTSVYVVPSHPGHYQMKRRQHYNTGLLVTGVDLHPESRQVALVGYRHFMPVVIYYRYGVDPGLILCGGKGKVYPLRSGRQAEGICFDPQGDIYISTEQNMHKPALFKLSGSLQ